MRPARECGSARAAAREKKGAADGPRPVMSGQSDEGGNDWPSQGGFNQLRHRAQSSSDPAQRTPQRVARAATVTSPPSGGLCICG